MALRLAGKEYSIVQGLDSQGWLRTITTNDALPGVIVDQQGAGRLAEFQQNGTVKAYIDNAGVLIFTSGNVIRRDVDNDGINLRGGSATAGAWIALSGKDSAIAAGGIRLSSTNAARTGNVERVRIPGDADSGNGSVIVYEQLDAREAIKNTGASNSSAVAVNDVLASSPSGVLGCGQFQPADHPHVHPGAGRSFGDRPKSQLHDDHTKA